MVLYKWLKIKEFLEFNYVLKTYFKCSQSVLNSYKNRSQNVPQNTGFYQKTMLLLNKEYAL